MRNIIFISAALVFIALSSFFDGCHSSAVVRYRRQANGNNVEDTEFPFEPIENERAVPAADESVPIVAAAASVNNDTNPPAGINTTMAMETGQEEGSDTVTVTVVVVILVVAVVLGVGVFVYLRIRRRRMADYEKKTQIQMSSTSNAGVYVDLTATPVPEKEKQTESPETEHLNKEED